MFCVVLAEKTWEEVYSKLNQAKEYTQLFELRLDYLEEPFGEPLERLLALPYKFICTFRAREEGGARAVSFLERLEVLERCASLGAYLIDLEWKSFLRNRDRVTKSPFYPDKFLFSYHNFEKTPPITALKRIIKEASYRGIKRLKITTFCQSLQESLNLLSLIEYGKAFGLEMIVFGMGGKGRLSRLLSLLLGAPFTYVFPPGGQPLAPGQMDILEAKRLFEVLKNV